MTEAPLGAEHLDVLIVGAGLSGIGAAHHISTACPWADFAVLEARDTIGGTWDLFRYPGIRSDSDMFTLGYPFRPWQGRDSIASGGSILEYIRGTAAEDGTDRHIRFNHRIVTAEWSTDDARWTVTAERTDTGDPVTLTCGFLFSCSGYYRYDHGHEPDFAGRDRFEGEVVHPQHWPDALDHAGKRIVVIGSGATAVTLVPALAETATHVTMLQRSPTYVASLPTRDPLANLLRGAMPDRVSGPLVRWIKALVTQGSYRLSRRRPELMKKLLRAALKPQLPRGYDIDTHFGPRYDPWDQRLCVVADGDLFKAIGRGTVSVVTDRIDTFTETGVALESGAELEADIIVTATGLEMLLMGGIDVYVDGEPVDFSQRLTYKGMMLEGVPNLAMAFGYTNASWTLKSDLTCGYIARLLNHMRDAGLMQATAVDVDGSGDDTTPMLSLTSGYIRRGADRFPRQGSKDPWRVHQSYLRDYRATRMSDIVDDALVLGNPVSGGRGSAGPSSDGRPRPEHRSEPATA